MVGTIDVNVTPISNSINSVLYFNEGIMAGVATQSNNIGTALGIVLAVGMYLLLLATVIGLLYFIFKFLTGLRGKIHVGGKHGY